MNEGFDAKWDELAEEVMSGMKEWRLPYPKATLRQIEQALDKRLAKMRARMLHACSSAALASAAADIEAEQEAERPVFPECGARLEGRGTELRQLTTQHNQTLDLARSYGAARNAEQALFVEDMLQTCPDMAQGGGMEALLDPCCVAS